MECATQIGGMGHSELRVMFRVGRFVSVKWGGKLWVGEVVEVKAVDGNKKNDVLVVQGLGGGVRWAVNVTEDELEDWGQMEDGKRREHENFDSAERESLRRGKEARRERERKQSQRRRSVGKKEQRNERADKTGRKRGDVPQWGQNTTEKYVRYLKKDGVVAVVAYRKQLYTGSGPTGRRAANVVARMA